MPSQPPKAPTTELGHVASWAEFSGYPMDPGEETPELFWPNSVRIYDRMRRTDAQVRGTYWALTLPLRRNIWALEPGRAREEVVQLVADSLDLPIVGVDREPPLRRQDRFSWAEHLRLALLDLIYGHMPFEQVYRVDGTGAQRRARLRKLGPRFPATLSAINVAPDGGLVSIQQYPTNRGQKAITIPVDRLVYYCNEREGGSWQGQSILRACYKHWLLKDRGLRTWAMSLERTGMGVPMIEAPENATEPQIKELNLMAQNYRAGESAGGALPHGAVLRLIGVTGNVPNAGEAVGYHDNAISKSMFTQFMQLGTDANTGNRALVSGFLDFFALATDGIAGHICDVTTQHVVEDLVDHNWGPEEPAPTVTAKSVDTETDIPLETLVHLIQVGAITLDDELEDWLREKGRLPRRGQAARAQDQVGQPPAAASRRARRPVRAEETEETPSWEALIRDQLGGLVNVDALVEGAAVEDAVTEDVTGVMVLLDSLWQVEYDRGSREAREQLDEELATAASRTRPVRASLTQLFQRGPDIAAGIIGSLRDRLALARSRAREAGLEDEALADVLEAIAYDDSHARLIAITETRRAVITGALDLWAAAGVTETQWLRTSGSDLADGCAERHGTTASSWEPPPPLHPRCECRLRPVMAAAAPERVRPSRVLVGAG